MKTTADHDRLNECSTADSQVYLSPFAYADFAEQPNCVISLTRGLNPRHTERTVMFRYD
jgi:hypothetical protein